MGCNYEKFRGSDVDPMIIPTSIYIVLVFEELSILIISSLFEAELFFIGPRSEHCCFVLSNTLWCFLCEEKTSKSIILPTQIRYWLTKGAVQSKCWNSPT